MVGARVRACEATRPREAAHLDRNTSGVPPGRRDVEGESLRPLMARRHQSGHRANETERDASLENREVESVPTPRVIPWAMGTVTRLENGQCDF